MPSKFKETIAYQKPSPARQGKLFIKYLVAGSLFWSIFMADIRISGFLCAKPESGKTTESSDAKPKDASAKKALVKNKEPEPNPRKELQNLESQLEDRGPAFKSEELMEKLNNWKKQYPRRVLEKSLSQEQYKIIGLDVYFLQGRILSLEKDHYGAARIFKKIDQERRLASIWPPARLYNFYYQAALYFKENKDFRYAGTLLKKALGIWHEKNDFQARGKEIILAMLEFAEVQEREGNLQNLKGSIGTHKEIIEFDRAYHVLNDLEDEIERYAKINQLYQIILKQDTSAKVKDEYAESTGNYLKMTFRGIKLETIKKNNLFQDSLEQYISIRKELGRFLEIFSIFHTMERDSKTFDDMSPDLKYIYYYDKFSLYFEMADYNHAQKELQKANGFLKESSPNQLKNLFLLGHAFLLAKQYQDAEDIYKQIIRRLLKENIQFKADELDPVFPFNLSKYYAYYLVGMTYLYRMDTESAKNYFKQATLGSQEEDALITIRANIQLILLHLEKKEISAAEAILKTVYTLAYKSKDNYLIGISQSLELLMEILKPNDNSKQIRKAMYPTRNWLRKDPALEYMGWLLDLADAAINKKNSNSFLPSLEKALKGYYKNFGQVEKNGIYFFYVPGNLLERAISFSFDQLLKERKYSAFIQISEIFRQKHQESLDSMFRDKFSMDGRPGKDDFAFKIEAQQSLQFSYIKDFILQNYRLTISGMTWQEKRKLSQEVYSMLNSRKKEFQIRQANIREMEIQKNTLQNTGSAVSVDDLHIFNLKNALPKYLKKLPADFGICYYTFLNENLYGFMLSANGIENSGIKINQEKLLEQLDLFRKNLTEYQNNNYETPALDLYRSLYAEARRYFLEKQISIVGVIADRELESLPFSALMYSKDKFLIDEFSFFYMMDFLPLFEGIKPDPHMDWKLTALYNPSLEQYPNDVSYTATEVDLIQSLFIEKKLLNEDQVIRNSIISALETGSIWHFSLPGKVDTTAKEIFYFFIAKDDDGIDTLGIKDFLQLKPINKSLAFFSNLEWVTRKESSYPDKPFYFMKRTMRKAGFPFTIYSLWPSDKSKDNIGLLVSAFYRKLRRDSPFKALRLSQLRVKQRKDHPFYWAGILLHKHSQER